MTIGNKKVRNINTNTYVAYKQNKEKTELDNIRIVQIKDLPIKNDEIIEVMFPYMNNTVPIIKLVDRFYSYIDVRDELEDEVEDEFESLEEDSKVNSKGERERWDEIFPTIDGVMDVNDFNQMLDDMRHFYDESALSENKNNLPTLSDIVDNSIIVITDDINSIDGDYIAKQYQLDDEDFYFEEVEEESNKFDKFIVSEEDLKKVLTNIANNHIDIVMRNINKRFMNNNNLSKEDIRLIVKQLALGDYSYSLKSKNIAHLGNILTVFITGKDFELTNNKQLKDLTLYIKVDDSDDGYVTTISIHKGRNSKLNNNPYKKKEESIMNPTDNVYQWYKRYFKDDYQLENIRKDITFKEVYDEWIADEDMNDLLTDWSQDDPWLDTIVLERIVKEAVRRYEK